MLLLLVAGLALLTVFGGTAGFVTGHAVLALGAAIVLWLLAFAGRSALSRRHGRRATR
ncbi:MAG TPA: hypothetical protein VGM10_13555 [Actinocrinis sp.]|jgi:hypothetical protein